MRRLFVTALVGCLLLTFYSLGYAEGGGGGLAILPNAGFEQTVTFPSLNDLSPLGWSEGAEGARYECQVADVKGKKTPVIVLTETEPGKLNSLRSSFPFPAVVKSLAGKEVKLTALVKVDKAKGSKKVGDQSTALTGVTELKLDTDFTAAEGFSAYDGMAGVDVLFTAGGKPAAPKAKRCRVAFSPTSGYMELSCTAVVPEGADGLEAVIFTKGASRAAFSPVKMDLGRVEVGDAKRYGLGETWTFDTGLLLPPEGVGFPFGWQRFLAKTGAARLVVRRSEAGHGNGLFLESSNPRAIYTTTVYDPFPLPEALAKSAGKKIRLSAKVKVLEAAGEKEGERLYGVKTLREGADFNATDEMRPYMNFAGVNILFATRDKDDGKGKKTKGALIPVKGKVRSVAFSPTADFVELFCEAEIPEGAEVGGVLLEVKGTASAVFTDVKLDMGDIPAAQLMPPFNLDMKKVVDETAPEREHPREWFYQITADRAYAHRTNEKAHGGRYALEIGNPDPMNATENVVYTVNFDISANKALWGKEIELSALVSTELPPGTHNGTNERLLGTRTLKLGEDVKTPFEFLKYSNYASVNIICRNSRGNPITPEEYERGYLFGTSSDWKEISTRIKVPPRTFSIEWQMVLKGYGRAWFDDVSFKAGEGFKLTNLGFEEVYEPAPVGWRLSATTNALMVTEEMERDGKKSRALCLISPSYAQVAPVKARVIVPTPKVPAGYKLVLTGEMKTEFNKNDFQQYAYLEMRPISTKKVDVTPPDAWPRSVSLSGKSDWTTLKSALIVEDSVTYLLFDVYMKGIGRIYVDDLKLEAKRLAFPSSALKNPSFAMRGGGFPAWKTEGLNGEDEPMSFSFGGSPIVYGRVKKDGARIYQDLSGLSESKLQELIGKPVTFKAMVRCEAPNTCAAGVSFIGTDGVVLTTKTDETPVEGVPPADFLSAPFRLTKVTAEIPAGTKTVRVFVEFKGGGGEGRGRYQITRFRLMGEDPVSSRDVLGLPAGLPDYRYDEAEMDYTPPEADGAAVSEGDLSHYLIHYGAVVKAKIEVPSGALANANFSSSDQNRPTSYEFEGLKCYTLEDSLYDYTVLAVNGGKVRVAQEIPFPEDARSEMAGKTFKFTATALAQDTSNPVAGVEFLDANGEVVGTAVTAPLMTLSSEESTEDYYYKPEKVKVKAKIPEGAAAARVFLEASGNGRLYLSKAEMGYVYVASGFLDWLAYTMIFDFSKLNVLVGLLVFGFFIIYFIYAARRKDLFIRKIPGLDSVDEAVGRATEMGKPILFCPGLDTIDTINTIAALNILGRVAKKVAEYDTPLIVPNRDPIVMTVAQETVKSAFMDAGRPDAYREDSVYYITDQQFAYVTAVAGTMMRDRPAANFFMGGYYAESLILAETGSMTGAIQVAGTDAVHQLPFFIVACDYTLIGEELYAASAYLSREPMQMGSLKGSDYSKMIFFVIIIIGTIAATLNLPSLRWILELMKVQ